MCPVSSVEFMNIFIKWAFCIFPLSLNNGTQRDKAIYKRTTFYAKVVSVDFSVLYTHFPNF
jgi:hypothetical protein